MICKARLTKKSLFRVDQIYSLMRKGNAGRSREYPKQINHNIKEVKNLLKVKKNEEKLPQKPISCL